MNEKSENGKNMEPLKHLVWSWTEVSLFKFEFKYKQRTEADAGGTDLLPEVNLCNLFKKQARAEKSLSLHSQPFPYKKKVIGKKKNHTSMLIVIAEILGEPLRVWHHIIFQRRPQRETLMNKFQCKKFGIFHKSSDWRLLLPFPTEIWIFFFLSSCDSPPGPVIATCPPLYPYPRYEAGCHIHVVLFSLERGLGFVASTATAGEEAVKSFKKGGLNASVRTEGFCVCFIYLNVVVQRHQRVCSSRVFESMCERAQTCACIGCVGVRCACQSGVLLAKEASRCSIRGDEVRGRTHAHTHTYIQTHTLRHTHIYTEGFPQSRAKAEGGKDQHEVLGNKNH